MTVVSSESTMADEMLVACSSFLDSLDSDQRSVAMYPYLDGERIFWYYPPLNRHGLSLRDMGADQRDMAYRLMAAGLTDRSYGLAKLIIDHESVLGPIEREEGRVTFARDPELYYFTVFGEPGGEGPWGWRVEGHHISLHFSVWNGKVISMTPFFFGANPAEVRKGPKTGLRILDTREDLAFQLMDSMDASQRSKTIIYDQAPWDILTYNSSKALLPAEEGLGVSRMSETQREILMSLVTEYVTQVRPELAGPKLEELRQEGFRRIHWAWAGPVETGKAHYYRIHGGNFVVEFDNRQNGANHIHSVWRDVENDFAEDVMRQHLLAYHVL